MISLPYMSTCLETFQTVNDLLQLPASAQWGSGSNQGNTVQGNLSLAEIQAIQEKKERQEQEEVCLGLLKYVII